MKERGMLEGNKIVTTIMSNLGLYKALDRLGIKYERTAVGDKYVFESMMANGYQLGGEQSGHIIFRKHAATGDGILTAIMLMEVILEKKMSLSKLAAPVVTYPQVLKNVRVKDKAEARNDVDVKLVIDEVSRELGEDGRILVRESGTEPMIRIMVEAADLDICEALADRVVGVIIAKGHVVGQ